jgi:hypothetical protein
MAILAAYRDMAKTVKAILEKWGFFWPRAVKDRCRAIAI